jgi:serine/threonine-protein kinase
MQFGKFTLVEKIAQGGMAEVYRAVMRGAAGFEKTIALKRILPLFSAEADFVTLFCDEARIASTLTHANLVQTFDFGEVGGAYYLACELVEGVDLARLVDALKKRGQPFPTATAAFIVAEAARGLGYAHDKRGNDGRPLGIIHRDVSPQNVLLSYSGEIKVADFGIAKAAETAHKTATGLVMGKLRYMAPEQVAGDELDGRADLFALGVILYELLTSGPLFPEQGARVAELVHAAPIVPPSVRVPGLPAELERIVLKALGRPREQRYARAADLARDLQVWVNQDAPGFTRDDVGALLAEMCPAGALRPAGEAVPAVAAAPEPVPALVTPVLRKNSPSIPAPAPLSPSAPTQTASGSGSPQAMPRQALIVDDAADADLDPLAATELRQLEVPTRTRAADGDAVPEPVALPRTARAKKLASPGPRRSGGLAILFGVIIVGSLGFLAFHLFWGQPAPLLATTVDAGPPRRLDAGHPDARSVVPPIGALELTPAKDDRTRAARDARFDVDLGIARAGLPGVEYELLMSALDVSLATMTVDERGHGEAVPLPEPLAAALAAHDLTEAHAELVQYVIDFAELPLKVRSALHTFLARNPAWQPASGAADQPRTMAVLAVWLLGQTPARLDELAEEVIATERSCDPPPPPRHHLFRPGCERAALAALLRQAGDEATAARVEP